MAGLITSSGSIVKRKIPLLAVVVLIASAAAVLVVLQTEDFYSRGHAEGELRAARTAAEERVAFDRMARHSRVSFALYDAVGEQLGMSTSDWPNRAHFMRFYQFGDPPLVHTIIERKNITTLMRE